MKTIRVDEAVREATPAIIRDLPEGRYRLQKVSNKENPIHCTSRIPLGHKYIGDLTVCNRGGPAIALYTTEGGGIMTSLILGAEKTAEGPLEVSTENSIYELCGPLTEEMESAE